ncbi:palmitoyltransferase erf2 isoform X2 [Folsomia candida]|uniref:palmitoyltransferase erf2 isoform X2 n=1 Tax=Folsomia candida TaxID=158441 RepID=UPI001604ED55|nr:palmitoyltransferase erf2 isoform X2 [Folsomia candida]
MFHLTRFRNPIPHFVKVWRTRPAEAASFSLIIFLAVLVYYYGTFIILPEILEGHHLIIKIALNFLLPNWIFFAVLSNMILIQVRDSSIRNKFLAQPVLKPPPPSVATINGDAGDTAQAYDKDHELKERTKYIGQHFVATPFQDDQIWHICAACEIFVPPRTWHCHSCNTCILRRDHHCIITMGCIGEENHCNFIGMLFYVALGTSLASTFSLIYHVYFVEVVWWMFLLKCFVPYFTIFYDPSALNILSGITLVGQWPAWGMFSYYLYLALRGQTSADFSRGIRRAPAGSKTFSFQNMKMLLGPNPLLRILWPYHQVIIQSIDEQHDQTDLYGKMLDV